MSFCEQFFEIIVQPNAAILERSVSKVLKENQQLRRLQKVLTVNLLYWHEECKLIKQNNLTNLAH
jgi:hypothetical protein